MGYGRIYSFEEPSQTAKQYLKYGYVYMRPFEPGQRYRSRKNIERAFSGYGKLRREVRALSEEIEDQRMRQKSVFYDYQPRCTLKTSPMGFLSQKGVGNQWIYSIYPHDRTFSFMGSKLEYNPNLPRLYSYYGKRRFEL